MANLSDILPPGNIVTAKLAPMVTTHVINDNSGVAEDRHLFALEYHNG